MNKSNLEREWHCKFKLKDDKDDICRLMVEEARQSFYQRENLVRSLDTKSFGVVGVNAILFSMFLYVKTIIQNNFLYTPYFLLIASLILITLCIWPREWNRQDCTTTIENYGNRHFKIAAVQLAINYATWDSNLKEIYNKKLFYFEFGLILTLIAFFLELLIFLSF